MIGLSEQRLAQAQGLATEPAADARAAETARIFYRRKNLAPITGIAGPVVICVMAIIAGRFSQFTLALMHGRHQPGWMLFTLIFAVIAAGSAVLVLVFLRAMARAYRQRGERLIVVDDTGVTLDRASGTVAIPWDNITGAMLQQLPHGGVFLRIRVRVGSGLGKGVTAAGVPLNLVQLDGAPDDVVRAILGNHAFKA